MIEKDKNLFPAILQDKITGENFICIIVEDSFYISGPLSRYEVRNWKDAIRLDEDINFDGEFFDELPKTFFRVFS